MATDPPVVRMEGILKRFGETVALDQVAFDLRPGEIHALLGENGAGKSTLMHVLSGLYAPDAGTIEVRGRAHRFRSARDAARAGIGMVHQHFTLVENFTVAENLALALPHQTPVVLPRRDLARAALDLAARLGWRMEPNVPVWQLPVGMQQRLEIVKVLAQDPAILVLDEPTAVLAPVELDELFTVLRRLREEGRSLVFISHKLNEVLSLCDRITVLRRGTKAGTVPVCETDAHHLARWMMGAGAEEQGATAETQNAARDRAVPPNPSRAREQVVPSTSQPAADEASENPLPSAVSATILRLEDIRVRDQRGLEAVCGLSLDVSAGEILGIAGVDGNGQAELAEAILGLRRLSRGSLQFAAAGEDFQPRVVRERVGYIPQDRRRDGLVLGMSVRDNLILELHQEARASRGPWLRWGFLNSEAAVMRERYDVRSSSLLQTAGTLSGGNQQKIVIARALHKQPSLLVAVNPTRGLDVNATAYVHERLREQRERGAAVLLISTELEEVIALSDRVGVLYEGRLMAIVAPTTPREQLGLLMGGKQPGVAAA